MLGFSTLCLIQISLIGFGGLWFLKRNDEIPLLVSGFLFYVASYRFWAVQSGINGWVNITNFGFDAIIPDAALGALAYIVFGELTLLGAYCCFQSQVVPVLHPVFNNPAVFRWLRPKLLLLGLSCVPLVISIRGSVSAQVRGGKSLAFQVSGYLFLLPLLLIGVAILLAAIWRFGGLPKFTHKLIAGIIFFNLFNLTFRASGRFQFLGWMIAAGIVWSSTYRPWRRLVTLTAALAIALGLFGAAGAMRSVDQASSEFNQAAWQRAFSAEDANMLDGFVLIQQVYPERLDFRFGMEHGEVLLRPIPRAIWPGKPVGGYMNKLGLIDENSGFTLGISPSLIGSFYADGGFIAILFWSIVYGFVLARVVVWSTSLQDFFGIIVRAMLCAALVPLLRGGDLPGVYAWLGMAFWPCLLVLWLWRQQLSIWFSQAYSAYPAYSTMPSPLPKDTV